MISPGDLATILREKSAKTGHCSRSPRCSPVVHVGMDTSTPLSLRDVMSMLIVWMAWPLLENAPQELSGLLLFLLAPSPHSQGGRSVSRQWSRNTTALQSGEPSGLVTMTVMQTQKIAAHSSSALLMEVSTKLPVTSQECSVNLLVPVLRPRMLKGVRITMMRKKINTPGTAGGPGGRDRTLAVAKNRAKMTFFSGGKKNYLKKIFFFCIYLLVMPKYWVKNYFAHGRFSEVGQKQKTEKKKREKERKKERKLVITMAKLRMAHASTHGARKPPGPKMISVTRCYCQMAEGHLELG